MWHIGIQSQNEAKCSAGLVDEKWMLILKRDPVCRRAFYVEFADEMRDLASSEKNAVDGYDLFKA